jgi:hypothetical protein
VFVNQNHRQPPFGVLHSSELKRQQQEPAVAVEYRDGGLDWITLNIDHPSGGFCDILRTFGKAHEDHVASKAFVVHEIEPAV